MKILHPLSHQGSPYWSPLQLVNPYSRNGFGWVSINTASRRQGGSFAVFSFFLNSVKGFTEHQIGWSHITGHRSLFALGTLIVSLSFLLYFVFLLGRLSDDIVRLEILHSFILIQVHISGLVIENCINSVNRNFLFNFQNAFQMWKGIEILCFSSFS